MAQVERPFCPCHGEPCYWQKDVRLKAGGWWECSVTRRARQIARYDGDPIYRIGKTLAANARRRRQTIERKRARVEAERN